MASKVKLFMNIKWIKQVYKTTKNDKAELITYINLSVTLTHTKLTIIVLEKRRKMLSWKVYEHWIKLKETSLSVLKLLSLKKQLVFWKWQTLDY